MGTNTREREIFPLESFMFIIDSSESLRTLLKGSLKEAPWMSIVISGKGLQSKSDK